jgi:predicted lipase
VAPEFRFNPLTTTYSPHNAYWLARASKLAYQRKRNDNSGDPDEQGILAELKGWNPEFQDVTGVNKKSSQAFVANHEDFTWIVFRGTDEWRDWLDNVNVPAIDHPLGRVHRGFQLALDDIWPAILGVVKKYHKKRRRPIWITGHSLGGALATVAAADLIHQDRPFYGVYTFGQPRCGDRQFSRFFNVEAKSRYFRFQNNNDIVSRIPQRLMGYSHVGTFLYIDRNKEIKRDISFWFQFVDRLGGILEALDETGTDLIEDHAIDDYIKALEKNIDYSPFGG